MASKQCLQAMLTSTAMKQRTQAYARTYVRTNEELLTLSSYLTVGNARRGVAKKMIDRTPEQHRADVIAAALQDMPGLIHETLMLRCRIEILAASLGGWEKIPESLQSAHHAYTVMNDAQTALRDIACEHPIRGLDYEWPSDA